MLKSLYDYALRNDLTLPPGYVNKTVKAYILLHGDGSFQDVEIHDNEVVAAPDIGSLANGTDKSNVLLEKRSVVIPETETKKSGFFLEALIDGGREEPMLKTCADALQDAQIRETIRTRLDEKKIKPSDRISFKVDYHSILESNETKVWWQKFRQSITGTDSKEGNTRCLITGNLTVPVQTTTPISGLQVVGGHARGDALICFDKTAYCSYDLKKALNAPVSEEAFAAVKVALDDLLQPEKAPILSGMKFVHWYDRTIEPEDDPLIVNGDFLGIEDSDEEELQIVEVEDDYCEESPSEAVDSEVADKEEKEAARDALKAANKLIHSVKSGERVYMSEDVQYHILLLSGVNGRVMIRRYERGKYEDLKEKLKQWHEDLSLVSRGGKGEISSCKLTARLMRLMKRQKKDSKPFDRMAKELSGITPAIITAILSGGLIPDSVVVRALSTIRSQMLDDDASEREKATVCYAYQWLKVWLIRNRKKGGFLLKEYNPNYEGAAYHCGAMMAVYEEIQRIAMPQVNASVAQRYFASAMQTPALVMGTLSRMSVHHLEKFKNEWLANEMRDRLKQISTAINGSIPTTLNLEQQSEFALGYYQMGAEINRIRIERSAAKKGREERNEA